MTVKIKHLLTINDLTYTEILKLFKRTKIIKKGWLTGYRPQPLKNKIIALIFEKPSTRTRVSFEVAVYQLGGKTIFITKNDSQLGRFESLKDTARVMNRYVDSLIVRTFDHQIIKNLAKHSLIPVINALTDLCHPCQVLADLFTVDEHFSKIKQLAYAWIGDGNNMANSWIEAAGILGLELRLACPTKFHPNLDILKQAQKNIEAKILLTNDPKEAIYKAQVISTDTWTSMGQEAETKIRQKYFIGYTLNKKLLKLADNNAIVLHCLPAHRGKEITKDVLEGTQAAVWNQAENRLHVQKVILELLIKTKIS